MKKLSSSTFIYRKSLIESGEMGTVVFSVEWICTDGLAIISRHSLAEMLISEGDNYLFKK